MKISFGLLVEGLAIVEGLGIETCYGCMIQGLPEERNSSCLGYAGKVV